MKTISDLVNDPETQHCYAVITGASQGLGKGIAYECAKKGFHLILLALPEEGLEELSETIRHKFQVKVVCREVDLTNRPDLDKTIDWINQNFKVKILVNNAGIGGSRSFQGVSSDYVDQIISLNIRVLVHLTHCLIDNLKANSKSYILNIASLAAFGPIPYKTVYPASKAFVYSFSRSLGTELKKDGISVSVAHPGGMATNADVSARIKRHCRLVRSTILSPEKTAEICIKQLFRKDPLIVPGIMNKVSWVLLKICPVSLKLLLFKNAIQKNG